MLSMWRRTVPLIAIIAAVLLAPLGGPAHAAGPAVTATWQLVDNHQTSCFVSARGGTGYYGIWISGSWQRQIDVGASALPAGGSYSTAYAPIPAGSSDGVGSLAYVAVALPVGAAAGTFTASLWASDGTTTQAVAITLVVQPTSCRRY